MDNATGAGAPASVSSPPVARRVAHPRTVHGETMDDPYAWLRDRDDPTTLAYLDAENAYCATATAHLGPLQEQLFQEIKARTQETDFSAPVRQDDWWYYTRTEAGKQYGLHCRRRTEEDEGAEEVVLDQNLLAGVAGYFALGHFLVSPSGRLLAYSTNHDGSESYTLHFKDLDTGAVLPDEISGAYYSGAWSRDSSIFFYVTHDAAMRPYRVWRHRLGDRSDTDTLLHEEMDERFFAGVRLTRSKQFVLINLDSQITSEVRLLAADAPLDPPRVIAPRRQGVEYQVDHCGNRFFILHNDGAVNFTLASAPVEAPERATWQTVIPERTDIRLNSVHAFADHLVVHLRRAGNTGLRILPVQDGSVRSGHDVAFPEPVYTVYPGDNRNYATALLRFNYASLTTPQSTCDYDVGTRALTLKKRQPVLGGYDPDQYESAREWATADDGVRIPISLVWRRGTPRDGSARCLLYGYGAYEASMEPTFSIPRLSLLDRGCVYAIAHVRGGGELGRRWYEDGKLLHKHHTFSDFVACADHLAGAGRTSHDRLVARGASAGGLLMGAVANLAPEKFRAIVAQVPFVDALNTILDPSLPLTVIEWEEWGNPLADAAIYRAMRSYSPYDNVEAKAYPALLVTAGFNDPRVGYHEPAKWVAKLRAMKTDTNVLLLKTEMGAGHGGKSGRYDAWQEEAFVLAFVLDMLRGRLAQPPAHAP